MPRKALITAIVAGLILPPLALRFYLLHRVENAAGDLLAPLADRAEIFPGRPFFRLDGSFGLDRLEIRPLDASRSPSSTGRITVNSPGWGWSLSVLHQPSAATRLLLAAESPDPDDEPAPQGPPRIKRLPEARRLSLAIEDLRIESGDLLPLPFDIAGWSSASLFETEGCQGFVQWRGDELRAMDLAYQDTSWRWEYRVTGPNEVHSFAVLQAAGVGRMERITRLRSPSPENHLSNPAKSNRILSETISLRDEGFVQARNRFCATRDGVNLPVFLQRHWQSVERLLAAMGLQVGNELRSVYMRFARDGGELVLEAEPAPTAAEPDASLTQRLRLYNATLRRGEAAPVSLRFQTAQPRPLLDAPQFSTFDLLLVEPSVDEPGAMIGSMADPVDPVHVLRRGRSSLFQPPTAALTSEEPDEVTEAPTQPAAQNGPARILALDPADAPRSTQRDLDLEQLDQYLGKRLRLHLADGRSRVGVIESVSADSVRVHVSLPSGSATYDIAHANIRRAHLIE